MVIMDSVEGIGNLEEQALKRKERLKNLKRKNPGGDNIEPTSEVVPLPKPKFRSYKPQDETLQEAKLDDALPAVVEEEVKDLLEAGKEKVVLQDLDISSLAPRKPDWDLKRDVAKKLEKLERRTQKAIAELIWERLKEGSEDNLGAVVTMADNRQLEED
ncbi:coiled-coil domain-containing protein 12 [Amyelois transitella]|uniref:coiled-coil domain-containing protein 12 n=1 Tax=Amyelois transitella TaxID=680683 RepID=UPI00067C21CC|nr:coiled-coil domain-containing protein 12 [Amyelois transitella]XP_060801825.1 coiled-coil domain-containing protein 12 [Amyelois transitella]